MNIEQDLIEGAEAAAGILGLTKRQVYHMVTKKRLPCTRIGNRLYFRRSELDKAFSAEQQTTDFSASTLLSDLVKRSAAACQTA